MKTAAPAEVDASGVVIVPLFKTRLSRAVPLTTKGPPSSHSAKTSDVPASNAVTEPPVFNS